MKYIQSTNLSLGLLSFNIVSVNAFQPSLIKTQQPLHQFASKNVDVDFFNPAKELDLAHAHDCAEHFGKCAVEDLENMRKVLHTERLQHHNADFETDFVEDLDHLLLEEDLSFQLALLKDEMHTLPQWSSPHFINDGKPAFSPPPVMVDGSTTSSSSVPSSVSSSDNAVTAVIPQQSESKPQTTHKADVQSFVQRGEEMFLIPNGLSDIAAFGVALLIISLTPFLFKH